MLSIKPIGSSNGEIDYYATLGGEDYYLKGGDPFGIWWGTGAAKLGLTGTVSRGAFRNLLLGVSTDGKNELVQNAGDPNRRAAFDLTLSVPKSVSCAWSQCEQPRRKLIEQACELALSKTLEVFDKRCGFTRRGHLGSLVEKADLIAAIFRHDTARGLPGEIPDANLHWHVVLINAVSRKDNSSGAFCARRLFSKDMKMMLGAMYRAQLSKELEALGLTSHRPEKENGKGLASWFELDAVPKDFVRAMSKRRREIEKWLIKHNVTGAKMAEKAALKTRREKEHFSRERLFTAWKEAGREYGFTSTELSKAFSQRLTSRNIEAERAAATERALARITDEWARFSEFQLLRFAAEEAQGCGIGIFEVELGVKNALENSAEIVQLQDVCGEKNYTTREMLATERRMLESAARGQGDSSHTVNAKALSTAFREFDTLRPEQREAIRHITAENSRVVCVNGMAGTGKTFLLGIARQIWERHGLEVVGTALAATAAKRLEEGSAIQSTHIHRFLAELENGKRRLTASTILVVDEAGMVGTKKMEQLTALSELTGAKLVLVGDYKQLQPITAGAPFRGIAARIGCYQLQDIIRQRESWAKQCVHELAAGDALSALAGYAERGLLKIAQDRDEAMEMLVADWANISIRHTKEALIFAGTNTERVTLNRLCQRERLRAGFLSNDCISVGGDELRTGDRVLFTKNNAALLVRNGAMGTITEINSEKNTLRVQFDGGLNIAIETESYSAIELGYAITTHKGQGKSVESSFVLVGGPMTDREISYVQGSRAAGPTRFYTDIVSGGESIETLAKQMSKSQAKELACDFAGDF